MAARAPAVTAFSTSAAKSMATGSQEPRPDAFSRHVSRLIQSGRLAPGSSQNEFFYIQAYCPKPKKIRLYSESDEQGNMSLCPPHSPTVRASASDTRIFLPPYKPIFIRQEGKSHWETLLSILEILNQLSNAAQKHYSEIHVPVARQDLEHSMGLSRKSGRPNASEFFRSPLASIGRWLFPPNKMAFATAPHTIARALSDVPLVKLLEIRTAVKNRLSALKVAGLSREVLSHAKGTTPLLPQDLFAKMEELESSLNGYHSLKIREVASSLKSGQTPEKELLQEAEAEISRLVR